MAWKTRDVGKEAIEFLERLKTGKVSEEERLAVSKLDLNVTNLSILPPEIGQLTNLTSLNLSFSRLYRLPPEIGHLTNLTSLDLHGNGLMSLPPEIGHLTNLTNLDLRRNKLYKLPLEIGQLTNLTSLVLSSNRLSSLPPEIGQLTNLTKLYLNDNVLSRLPPAIGELTNLTSLSLSSNGLNRLPPEIGQLTNLTGLYLSNNDLSSLPPEIGQLTNLTWLYLSNNDLSSLPPEIGQLTNLTWLYLGSNDLRSLPPEIGQLTNLTSLDLSFLNLDCLPPRLVLSWLDRGLSFTNNVNTGLGDINLHNTILRDQNIDIFLSNDVKRIREYCEDLIRQEEQGNMRVCNEARIVFLGDGNAGKTKTIQRILGIETDTAETYGVDFFPWQPEGKDYHFNIWDFGGQAILQPMHKCFLSDECLYVLVVRPRSLQMEITPMDSARYWLRMLNSYAPNSSVLIAVNYDIGTPLGESPINTESLQKEFPNFFSADSKAVVYCALKEEGDHFDQLQKAIMDKASALDSVKRELPLSALKVKKALETMDTPVIDTVQIVKLFLDAGITEDNRQDDYLNWFRNLGVCFWYEETKSVLDPKWITLAVYGLVRQIEIHKDELREEARNEIWPKGYANENGLIAHVRMVNLLSDETVIQRKSWSFAENYKAQNIKYLLSILRQYGISYPLGGGTEFIPALCPDEPGEGVRLHPDTYEKKLELVREYEMIPTSAIANMVVACGSMLDRKNCYKKIFRVQDNSLLGVVEFDSPYTRKLTITVYGFDENAIPGLLLHMLQEKADSASLGNPKRENMIYEVNRALTVEIPIKLLEKALREGKEEIDVPDVKTGEYVSIRVADVSGVYIYEDIRRIMHETNKTVHETIELVSTISDKEDVLISMLFDLGEENYGFREAVLDELGKNQEILPLIPSLEKELGKGFFRKLFDNVAGNVAATACMAAATKLATSIGPELSQALQIQALQNLPFLP